MVKNHGFAHVIALLGASILFSGCTSEDVTISKRVPKGYQRAHNITTESWESKAMGAMAVAETEAISTPATPEVAMATPVPEKWQPITKSPSLVSKLKQKSLSVARVTFRAAKKVARAARGKRKPRIMAQNTTKGMVR